MYSLIFQVRISDGELLISQEKFYSDAANALKAVIKPKWRVSHFEAVRRKHAGGTVSYPIASLSGTREHRHKRLEDANQNSSDRRFYQNSVTRWNDMGSCEAPIIMNLYSSYLISQSIRSINQSIRFYSA